MVEDECVILDEVMKDDFEIGKVFTSMFGFGKQIIYVIFQYVMHDVMEDVSHGSLICSTSVFKTERHYSIAESPPRGNKGILVLFVLSVTWIYIIIKEYVLDEIL